MTISTTNCGSVQPCSCMEVRLIQQQWTTRYKGGMVEVWEWMTIIQLQSEKKCVSNNSCSGCMRSYRQPFWLCARGSFPSGNLAHLNVMRQALFTSPHRRMLPSSYPAASEVRSGLRAREDTSCLSPCNTATYGTRKKLCASSVTTTNVPVQVSLVHRQD